METARAKPKPLHWFALALLVISVCINYADRGNLGVAAKSIEAELHFSQDNLGVLLGSFFVTYAAFQLVAGKLIDHWNVNWVYAAGLSAVVCGYGFDWTCQQFLRPLVFASGARRR